MPTSVTFSQAAVRRHRTVVLLRSDDDLSPGRQVMLLVANLPGVESELAEGAVVVLGRHRVRVRRLPIERST